MYIIIHNPEIKLIFNILILCSFCLILVQCFSDVIINNNKLNLSAYNELLRKNNVTFNSVRNSSNGAKIKKSIQNANLITKHNFYQNIRQKPSSVIKDYLITKYDFIQPNVVSPNPVHSDGYISEFNQNGINYYDSEITQTNLLNFLNITNPPILSTESVPYGQSIEVPEIGAYEITKSPNYYRPKPAVSPHIVYNTHQYYDFSPDNYVTTQKPPSNQMKPTTLPPKTTTIRTKTKPSDKHTVNHYNSKPTPTTPVFIFTYPDKRKKPLKRRPHKKRKKTVKQKYVLTESPMVVAVEDTLEGVYNYFEDLFTDTVQYPANDVFETVEVTSQSVESHKEKRKKKKKRKKNHKPKETKVAELYTTIIPLLYVQHDDEYDSRDSSISTSSSSKDSNSDYYNSASSEEYKRNSLRTLNPTKSGSKLKRLKNFNKPTVKPKNCVNKSSTKRITVRSLNTQANYEYTTPLSVRRKSTKNPTIGTSKGLVTHVHITNEFVEPTTPINPDLNRTKVRKIYDSNESSSDYYDDYFDFDDGDDDDDDDDEDATTKRGRHKKKSKKSNKKKLIPNDSGENYYDEFDLFTLPTISNMIPRIPGFNKDDTSNEVHGRSTTPNNIYSGTKFPYHTASNYEQENEKQNNPLLWYPPMFAYGVEETQTPIDLGSPASTTESINWFQSWFNDANESVTENPTTTTESSNNGKWWFPWLADNENEDGEDSETIKTTTTQPTTTARATQPLFIIQNPIPNAGSFLTFLTDKIKPKPTKPAALENPNKKMHYNDYQLWKLLPQSTDDVTTLEEYRMSFDDSTEVQWWKGPSLRSSTEILVSPNMTETVKEFLNDEYIKYEIIMNNVQTAILYENPKISNYERLQIEMQQGHPLTWHRYHSYDDIIKFVEFLQRQHPDNVELLHVGRSYEGRPLIVVRVHFDETILANSKKPSKSKKKFIKEKLKKIKKKAVFIECGVHGREWMSPAVGTWILNNLLKLLKSNNTIGETVRSVDWYILPVMNPDGYQFSFEFDRFWRKTRSNHKTNSFNFLSTAMSWMKSDNIEKTCYGVDPSRNWNVEWGTKGASQSKCSEFYMGPEPNSEPEIMALSKFLMEYRKKIKLFLSLHSYGQFISYPTMSNSTYSANEINDVLDMVYVAIEALRNSDSHARYKVDTSNDMMAVRSGTSDSFAMHEARIKYSYIVELKDTGHHGFVIPASYIENSAKTAFEIIRTMVDYL